MRTIHRIALVLVIVGAINWGLIGFFNYDLVSSIFGENSLISRVIFALVGLSGLVCIPLLFEPARDADTDVERSRQTFRDPNLGTEFGEELDFTDVKEPTKTDFDEKK